MQKLLNNVVRFRRQWRGREPGQVDKQLDFGVASELVRRGVAEFHEEPKPRKQTKRRK